MPNHNYYRKVNIHGFNGMYQRLLSWKHLVQFFENTRSDSVKPISLFNYQWDKPIFTNLWVGGERL